ncbi:hypothetical protein BH24BAC1_BH24BAC1_17390 [soil metagenome]|jgi:hypothetical protein
MKKLLKISGMTLMAIAVFSCEKEYPQPKEDDLLNVKLSTSVQDTAEKNSSDNTLSVE